jgi:superfamily I DNA/RNA helicase
MQRLKKYCEESEGDMIDVLNDLASGAITIPYTAPLIDRWQALQKRLFELADLEGVTLVDALWPQAAAEAIEIRSIAATIALHKPAPEDILEELRIAITQPELPGSDSDIIQVMSLHKSKGLTRDLVILAGCMAGTLPFIDDKDPPAIQRASLEEQRRLFYVAITRATKVLVISSAASLPIADAFRSGAQVVTRSFIAGVSYARTAFTPFLAELGNDVPTPVTGAQWRAQIGLPLGQR